MSGRHDDWREAIDVAAGRSRAGADVPAEVLAFARFVVALGRDVVGAPVCPAAVLSKAESVFRPPRASRLADVWRLLFDSWAGVVPALRGRGSPRVLRYGGEGGGLAVEVVPDGRGRLRLRGGLDRSTAGLRLVVEPSRGRAKQVEVDSAGSFDVVVEATSTPLRLALRRGRRTVARTDALPGEGVA